jgi:hypothetical protein
MTTYSYCVPCKKLYVTNSKCSTCEAKMYQPNETTIVAMEEAKGLS